jgi:hypothetical protein
MGLIFQPLFAQEDILKEFAESHNQRKFCFYPSTLRMVNVAGDTSFNELIAPIEKLLFYNLDSTSIAEKLYRPMLNSYLKEGYEEYAQVYGGEYDVFILGKERRVQEWVGVIKLENEAFAFYLIGQVNWQKIPKLTQTLQENDLLNLFDVMPGTNKSNFD